MRNKIGRSLIGLSLVLLAGAACTLGVELTPSPSFPTPLQITPFFPTDAGPTLLPLPQLSPAPSLEPTLAPATETAPALTTAPTAPAEAGTRLIMGPGRTVVYADDNFAGGATTTYLVGAQAGQFMMAMINSANQTLALQIQAPDGSSLVTASQKLNYWQGTLPLDGDYRVAVVADSSGGSFDLSVTIPARITFKSGAVSASATGSVAAHGITTYLLRALQGQTMSVKVTSPSADVFLTIYGLEDGNPYVRSVTGQTSATLKLPTTQDYVIQCVSTGEAAEDIAVNFTVK